MSKLLITVFILFIVASIILWFGLPYLGITVIFSEFIKAIKLAGIIVFILTLIVGLLDR